MTIIDLTHKGPAEIAHGWMLIGFTLNVLLLGIMVTQVYLYYVTYKKDKTWIKVFVAGLFLADIVNTIFDVTYLYRSLILEFGNVDKLLTADWIFAVDPAITAVIAMFVQLFFSWRVHVLTKTWIWPAIIIVVALMGGIAGMIVGNEVVKNPHFVDFQVFKNVVIVWLTAEAAGDVLITAILRQHKTGFQRSDLMVDRIIRLTVQTGMITMIVATFDLVFYLLDPSGIHLMFNFPLCKLYSNSVMSSLNSRRGWKFGTSASGPESEGRIVTTTNTHIRGRTMNPKANEIITLDGKGQNAEVYVHVESHELRDVQNSGYPEKGTVSDDSETKTVTPKGEKWGRQWNQV